MLIQFRMNPFDQKDGEHTPYNRGKQADMSVNVQKRAGIVPIPGMKYDFKQTAANVFYRTGTQHAQQEDHPWIRLYRCGNI